MRKTAIIAALIAASTLLVLAALRAFAPRPVPGHGGPSSVGAGGNSASTAPMPADGSGLPEEIRPGRTLPEGATATASEIPPRDVEFSAIILDARSKSPVPAVLSWCAQRVIADASGQLLAHAGATDGSERAVVSAPGYESLTLDSTKGDPDCWSLGTVLLRPALSLTVRVKDEYGASVAGASISVATGGRSGPLRESWVAGSTDPEGRIVLRVKQGELIIASHSVSTGSARAYVREEARSLELVLQRAGTRWIGFRDIQTGQPLGGIDADVVSRKSLPGLHWTGQSGADGRLPIVFPPQQVIVNTPGPVQFVRERGGYATTIAITLDAMPEADDATYWVDLSRSGGRWLRFVGPTGDEPVLNAIAESFRTSKLPDGQFSEVRVGSRSLNKGMLDIDPYIDSGAEPLHVVVTAPGLKPFDSRHVGSIPQTGETRDIRLEPLRLGVFQLVCTGARDPSARPRQPGAARTPVWIFAQRNATPAARLESDGDGFVRDVPNLSRTMLVCTLPSPAAVIAELQPDDLYRDPPIQVPMPMLSRVVVEFGPSEVPNEELEIASNLAGNISPRLEGASAVFGNLVAGRYAVGTAQQLAASAWKREFDPAGAFPLELLPGQELRIRADPSWVRRTSDATAIRGVVMLDGPTKGIVVALSERPAAEHFITAPRYYSEIDAAGGFEVPASPDVLSLAAGTLDADGGVFVPLTVFAPGDEHLVAKGAHVVVRSVDEQKELAILELKVRPRDFKLVLSLSRGLEPGGKAADFGWIPIGKHLIGLAGRAPSTIAIETAGNLELVLLTDGTIVPKH